MDEVEDVNDLAALELAIDDAVREEQRPSLIHVRSIIGYPAPNKQGTSKAHGSPLGEDEVRLAKEAMGLDPDKHFDVPQAVYEHMSQVARGAALQAEWEAALRDWRSANPGAAAEWDAAWAGRPLPRRSGRAAAEVVGGQARDARRRQGVDGGVRPAASDDDRRGGRSQLVHQHALPRRGRALHGTSPGRNVYFGVREHGMGGAVNGMAAHGGILRPYGSTFLQFADYMRGAIRLSALIGPAGRLGLHA